MAFRVGQKVVCVNDTGWLGTYDPSTKHPLRDSVYTIREIYEGFHGTSFLLTEIKNRKRQLYAVGFHEPGFLAWRFRPVVERKTDISIFTAMLDKTPEHVG